ncbi:helix-turn-helix domain-containing protein [Roseibium aggregatum]|uniref:Winged helix-turn-helix domain-containing protein n=1 Tax=Roseibium aggregatum TaxID=187304 RepID=A0A939J3A3_9HYPH|nr:helix-turn-helix domain-containing protein [Roseibium aggregatum]MBN9669930.1 winged helix-turn-helix domain-containing protein [Roseibium aggregatum]
MDLNQENARLRDLLDVKDARIAELEGLVSDRVVSFPQEWDLSQIQSEMLRFLLKRPGKKESLHAALYWDRDDGGPDVRNVPVHVCLLRRKLKPHGIEISWLPDRGYFLSDDMKLKIRRG